MKNKNDTNIFNLITFTIHLIMIIGYIMNLQNLHEYWKDVPILDISAKWYISLIGVFIPFIGVVTGYIW